MPKFSQRSRDIVQTLDDRLIRVVTTIISRVDFTMICGYRSPWEQQEAFDKGLSSKRPGMSKHNRMPSLAFDFAPYPIDWHNIKRFGFYAGLFLATGDCFGTPLRWGGDWDLDGETEDQTFMDLGHIELIT